MSLILYLRIHQKMLTSTRFLLKLFTIFPFFLHNFVQVGHRITGLPLLNSIFLSPMLLERVVTRELLFARRTNCLLFRTGLSMLLCTMITHLLFALCVKMTVWTLMFFLFFLSLSMSRCVLAKLHNSTIFTLDFFILAKSKLYLK